MLHEKMDINKNDIYYNYKKREKIQREIHEEHLLL